MDRYDNNYLNEDLQLQPEVAPSQTVVDEAELLAAQAAAEAAAAQQQQPGGAFNNVGQGLTGKFRDMMMQYWQETINSIEHDDHDFKNHQLPLARIKKVMKTDEDVRMISAEAPILFAKGCDVFITELTMRAWIHAEENKRRTLQKSDIAAALTKSDMFDFLIDVVPREEEKPKKFTGSRTYMGQPQAPISHQAHLQPPQAQTQSTGSAPELHQQSLGQQHQHQQNARSIQESDQQQDGEDVSKEEGELELKQENDVLLQQQLLQQQMLQQQLLQKNENENISINNNIGNLSGQSYQSFPNYQQGYQGNY